MHGHYQRRKAVRFLVVALVTSAIALPSAVDAGTKSARSFTATALTPASTTSVAKSASGRMAQTDPALLGRTDATPVNVVVKLDYDATASYNGDITGLAATSPSVTGAKLTGDTSAEQAYENYTGALDNSFRQDLAAAVPDATAGASLQRVYGGVAVQVPANQVSKLLSLDGVAAVQSDVLNHPDTIESPEFIGAPTVWDQIGGQDLAGQGVIFGDLDTGLWPEHPMVADNGDLAAPPPTASGDPRECNYGDNPLTVEADVFECNNKVIGGGPFIDTYNFFIGDEIYPGSARDGNGHGTHTTTTAAGNAVDSAPIFGIDRGPASGVAPGAWVIEYKVCGPQGCFGSDSVAAIAQAILDGVDVINFSIGGGAQPFSDPVELAFLDAYNAGITVAASAGNSGPGAATTDHLGPWLITVAASTQSRDFQSTLTVTSGTDSVTFVGTSLTAGVAADTPIVLAEDIEGYDRDCSVPLDTGTAAGVIVACHRGVIGRVEKGFNVLQGGAVGMILYNEPLADTESDNHFLPVVHLADGSDFLAFVAAHPAGVTGTFTDGVKAEGQGDVMAAFSSRGPGGQFLKPDITAPGVQVLAGHTPTHTDVAEGPEGEYYQAIAGTSMSSPHIAGSAILMQALHPDWSPGAIKSSLMTTANTNVVKEDLVTPADPFDFGSGRVDLTQSGSAAIVFEDTGERMAAIGESVVDSLDLNLPSINVPTMPGTVTVLRTATNVSGDNYQFKVSASAPSGSKIKVSPDHGRIRPGRSQTFKITISSNAPTGQYFGQIEFSSKSSPDLHLPVAFFNRQGDVTLSQSCDPASIRERQTTTCTVTAQNESSGEALVSITSEVSKKLEIVSATGATVNRRKNIAQTEAVTLAAPADGIPAIAPGETPGPGFVDLIALGVPPIAIGDEELINFDVPEFQYGGDPYTSVGVDSNGYIVVGGGTGAADNECCNLQTFPDPTAPNNVLAPFWTDLDGTGAPGLSVATLTDNVNVWLVVQWDVNVFGTTDARQMQVWIGLNGVQDISYAYGAATIGASGDPSVGLAIGAESKNGTEGANIDGPPTGSYLVTSTPGTPGGSLVVTLQVKATGHDDGTLTSTLVADLVVAGKTIVTTPIDVTRRN
ncbi:MAG: S8 family serine peptidase [Ilumatobacteraceae bacterium]